MKMKCLECGSVFDDITICPVCGGKLVKDTGDDRTNSVLDGEQTEMLIQKVVDKVAQSSIVNNQNVDDTPGWPGKMCCFFIWYVGLYMYHTNKKTKPNCAKAYLQWTIAGLVMSFLWFCAMVS